MNSITVEHVVGFVLALWVFRFLVRATCRLAERREKKPWD